MGVVEGVGEKNEITRARRLVKLVLRNGDATLKVLLLGNNSKGANKNVLVYVVDANMSQLRVWSPRITDKRTHSTVKVLSATAWLFWQSQVNTFWDFATVIEKNFSKRSRISPPNWNVNRMLHTPPVIRRRVRNIEVVLSYSERGEEQKRKKSFK